MVIKSSYKSTRARANKFLFGMDVNQLMSHLPFSSLVSADYVEPFAPTLIEI